MTSADPDSAGEPGDLPPTSASPDRPGSSWLHQRLNRDWTHIRVVLVSCTVLSLACLVTYLLTTRVLSTVYFISKADDVLGAMWAVISAIFVIRNSYHQSLTAASSRMAATSVSFLVCLVYLIFLPFHSWALAVLIGVSALIVTLIGRAQDAVTAAVTTAVVLVIAEVSQHHAWQQPILRFADTLIGVAIGLGAAWIDLRVIRPRIAPAS